MTAAASVTEQTGLERWVVESRARQGLPARIEDPDALLAAAALVAAGLRRREEARTTAAAS